jgi:hypothetical protein
MGTRADFYVGKGKSAEWIGSIAWDGYRDGIPAQILQCQSEEAFRHSVAAFLAEREDRTLPEQGWPWPWETSATTDCSYWFFDGRCWDAQGRPDRYVHADEESTQDDDSGLYRKWLEGHEMIEFPDMSGMKQREKFGAHSGIMVIGVPK